jgi:glycine C-acetyltransferase
MGKIDFLQEDLTKIKEQGTLITIRTISSPQDAWFVADGKRVLNMCSNNYLGLANAPELKEAAKRAIDEFGVGPGAVRTIAGTQTLHVELEKRLAEFKGTEATILLQSGFQANAATIPALVAEGDVIFSDEMNHASIIDGCRLTRAKVLRYAHNDPKDLEEKIKGEPSARRRLIITDGVFSMDGDMSPLPDIVEVAEKFDAITMVDDAHGEGVLGKGGRGIVDHFGLVGKVDIEIGTLSKAFGVLGGYVAGSRLLVEFLKQRARPFLFSTGLSPADVAACLAAVNLLERSDELVNRLWDNARYFKENMKAKGWDLGRSQTPITPVMVGDEHKAAQLSRDLFGLGLFAQSIQYPTVARGKARLRVMISAAHSKDDLDYALDKFATCGKRLGLI